MNLILISSSMHMCTYISFRIQSSSKTCLLHVFLKNLLFSKQQQHIRVVFLWILVVLLDILLKSNIKVGHLLSEFAIEFALELWCRMLLSKVTNKLSELWGRMWIESKFRKQMTNLIVLIAYWPDDVQLTFRPKVFWH